MATDIELIWPKLQVEGRLAYFAKSNNRVSGGWANSPGHLHKIAANLQCAGFHTYAHLNASSHNRGIKGSSRHITSWRHLFIDIDPVATPSRPASCLVRAVHRLPGYVWPCCTVIDSGRGIQAWVEIEPMDTPDHATRSRVERAMSGCLRHIAAEVGTYAGCVVDSGVGDLARVGRMPGTQNQKTKRPARLLSLATQRLDPAHILKFETPPPEPITVRFDSASTFKDVWPHLTYTAEQYLLEGVTEPGRHRAAVATCRNLHEVGVDRRLCESWMKVGASKSIPRLDDAYIERTVRDTYEGD